MVIKIIHKENRWKDRKRKESQGSSGRETKTLASSMESESPLGSSSTGSPAWSTLCRAESGHGRQQGRHQHTVHQPWH